MPVQEEHEVQTCCLIRAYDGKKRKFSTKVPCPNTCQSRLPPFACLCSARCHHVIIASIGRKCVQADQKLVQGKFSQQLQLLLRANMDGLRKRVKMKHAAKA